MSVAAFEIPAESEERRFLGSAGAPAGGGVVDSYATALSFEPRDEATESLGARFCLCSICMPGTATAVAIGSVGAGGGSHDVVCVAYRDPSATPDDLREAVNTLEETEPTARRVLGGTHPLAVSIGTSLRNARAVLHAVESGAP